MGQLLVALLGVTGPLTIHATSRKRVLEISARIERDELMVLIDPLVDLLEVLRLVNQHVLIGDVAPDHRLAQEEAFQRKCRRMPSRHYRLSRYVRAISWLV